MNPPRNRPIGVTLLAIMFLWIGGFGTLFFPLIMLGGDNGSLSRLLLGPVLHSESLIRFVGSVLMVLWYLAYVAYLIIGIGLWKLKNWARKSIVVISWLGMIGGFVAGAVAAYWSPLMGLAAVVWSCSICGWLWWAMMRPRLRYAFGDWQEHSATGESIPPPALSKKTKRIVAVAVPVTTVGIFATLLLFGIDSIMRNSEAYRMAMDRAQDSPCVAKGLGSPLKTGFMTGSITTSDAEGSAELSIPVTGPKGKGELNLQAKKSDGQWRIESLVLTRGAQDMQIVPASSDTNCQ